MKISKTLLYSFLFPIAMVGLSINYFCVAAIKHESVIAAVVNEGHILKSELRDRVNLVASSGQLEKTAEVRKQLMDQILKVMIDELLQIQLTEKFDLKVSDEELEQEFAILEERNGMQKGGLVKFLAHHKIPKSILMQQIKAGSVWRNYIRQRYRPLVQISNSEIQNAARRVENEKGQNQVLIAEIVLPFDTPSEARNAKMQATKLLQQLRKGAQFPMVAHQFSKSASAARGGDIGWITVSRLDAPLRQALEQMNSGGLSEPILSGDAYHIVLVRDQREAGKSAEKFVSFFKVFVPWAEGSTMEQKEQLFNRVMKISKTAKSLSILKQLVKSLPKVDTKMMPDTRLNSLHPQLRSVLEKLPKGKPSEAIGTPMGVFVFLVDELKEIQPNTEDEIRQGLLEKKLTQISQREMRNLRREAFIDIRG
ncbi:MAG: peptidylprolyl isomerase [Pseudomonadota bacterium]